LIATRPGRAKPDHRRTQPARIFRYAILVILFHLAGLSAANAAERWANLAETVFQTYGREQGLPHPVPISLAQDGDGFIWIGTQGGLARWDGYRFKGYLVDPNDPTSIPDSYIYTLHADPAGRLWIGTSAGGLARYDRDRDRFIRVPLGPAGAARVHIGAIADDGTTGLWVGDDTGLFHLTPDTGAIRFLQHDDADPGSLPAGQVQAVLPDHAGGLWVGTRRGLAHRAAGTDRFAPVTLAAGTDAGYGVTALHETPDGRIWVGTNRHGVYVIDGNGAPRSVPDTAGNGGTFETDWISAIAPAGEDALWFATRGAGIVALNTRTGETRRIRHDRTLPSSLAHDDVWALLRDRAGAMWVGGTGGLSYHSDGLGAVSTVFGASNRKDGVSGPDVYAILSAHDGRLWLGFISGGVDIIDPVAGRVGQILPDPAHPETALPQDIVLAMVETNQGDVYVGTFRGLYRIDGVSHQVSVVDLAPGRERYAGVSTMLLDQGVLWVGDIAGGLWGVRLDDKTLVFGPEESKRLNDSTIDTLTRGLNQDLWVGTRNGLNRIDLATHAVETVPTDPTDPTAFPSRFIASTLLDRQGWLWAATYGGGIAVMTGRTTDGRPQFRRLGLADGLNHVNVDKLLMDPQGKIWAGTDDGLAVIDPTSFSIRALRHAEGSPLLDFFENSGTVDAAGEPLFGAKGGMAIVQSDRLEDWTYHPPIVVSDIRVGGVAVPASRFNAAGSTLPLVLTPDTNSLAVEFSALDFTAPERNRYAYRLDGFDRDWIATDANRRLAAYTNLPPGRYTLRLRGTNRDGVWTAGDLAIPVTVRAAWYQTVWFTAAAALLGLCLIAALVRSRTAYLRRRQAELERQIAERTADLRAANARLFELATVDPLTGCANRRHFIERAHDLIALSRRPGSPISLLIIDLDEFKRVNDTYGHPTGDEVLRMVSTVGRGLIRNTDLLGRIGGEEFALLMPNTDADGAKLFAERLREAIRAARTEVEGTILSITISLGLAELRRDETFDQLYARADAALYAAKEAGRNRVMVSDDA
jgi:diguanylate cyclase (GGDEF)-like protein